MAGSFRVCSVRGWPERSLVDPLRRLLFRASFPLALEGEARPVVGRVPARLTKHRELRLAEGLARRQAAEQNGTVEAAHELRGGRVVDVPQAHHHSRHPGVEKSLGQTEQTLAADLLT